jgi:hypothetical protein
MGRIMMLRTGDLHKLSEVTVPETNLQIQINAEPDIRDSPW